MINNNSLKRYEQIECCILSLLLCHSMKDDEKMYAVTATMLQYEGCVIRHVKEGRKEGRKEHNQQSNEAKLSYYSMDFRFLSESLNDRDRSSLRSPATASEYLFDDSDDNPL